MVGIELVKRSYEAFARDDHPRPKPIFDCRETLGYSPQGRNEGNRPTSTMSPRNETPEAI
jgi:hypothetical protein